MYKWLQNVFKILLYEIPAINMLDFSSPKSRDNKLWSILHLFYVSNMPKN